MGQLKHTYTTHDIARICDVYPSTVGNWISSGKLKCSYETPGGHHRWTREELLSFLKEFNLPVPRQLAERPKRVLIVDDDEAVTDVLERAFSRRPGYVTEVRHDGVEALIRIGAEPPDLVVLDMVLPGMDGAQVCRVLKSKVETQRVKIVAISAKKTPHGAKVDAFFQKPLVLAELLAKCDELLLVAGIEAAARP